MDFDVKKKAKIIFPFWVLPVGWLLVVILTIIGVVLSIRYDQWLIFSRCGSLIVLVALFLAIIDHSGWAETLYKITEPKLTQNKNPKIEKRIKDEIVDEIQKCNLTLSEEEISFFTWLAYKLEFNSYREQFPARFGSYLKSIMQKHELIIATYGTLIWGFGDLIGSLISK
jgi:hypothetical protein